MRYAFVLQKDNPSLARAEAESLFGRGDIVSDVLVIDVANLVFEDLSRLAYTRRVLEVQSESSYSGFNWEDIIKGTYAVKGDMALANQIWKSLDNPMVDLDNPETIIESKSGIVGRQVFVQKDDFEARRAHLRPNLYPASLHPKLARAMVNLTGLRKGLILDPFCGTGGILIEAGLMRFDMIGSDISEEMIKRCEVNLSFFGMKADLIQKDAKEIDIRCDAIVTELPFGRNTSVAGDLSDLYKGFLRSSKKVCRKMVVSFPDIDIDLCKWKAAEEFRIYLHKSLSKKVLVLVNDL